MTKTMIKNFGMGAALLVCAAAPGLAQEPAQQPTGAKQEAPKSLSEAIASETFSMLGNRLEDAKCSADEGLHFKTKSGRTYINSALKEGPGSPNTERMLRDAERVINEAMTQNGQDKSGGAWYYLGLTNLLQGDLAAADSAFAHASELAPDCKAEIARLRSPGYRVVFNRGVDFVKRKMADSALVYFRQAASLQPNAPEAPYSMATTLFNEGKLDSASVYFQRAIDAAESSAKADTTNAARYRKMANEARFNYALALTRLQRGKDAVPVLHTYIAANPDDIEAKKLLANAYRAAGMADSAATVEKELVNAGAASGGAVTSGDVMAIGANLYKEKKYQEAADVFEKVLASDPYNRDALYNLANTYLALKNAPKMLATANKILALEPMSEFALKLKAESYRMQGTKGTAAGDNAVKLLALPIDVGITAVQQTPTGMTVSATATGRSAMDAQGKTLAPKAQTLTFEFLGNGGSVVATQAIEVPALKAGETHQFTVQGQGQGITGFRYAPAGAAAATGSKRK